jgi:hypothetical protein
MYCRENYCPTDDGGMEHGDDEFMMKDEMIDGPRIPSPYP